MDAVMAERVNKLAQSLKQLHLAMSSEEAYKRAEEILIGNKVLQDSVTEEKTLNELMGEKKPTEQKQEVEEIFIDSEAPKPPQQ